MLGKGTDESLGPQQHIHGNLMNNSTYLNSTGNTDITTDSASMPCTLLLQGTASTTCTLARDHIQHTREQTEDTDGSHKQIYTNTCTLDNLHSLSMNTII